MQLQLDDRYAWSHNESLTGVDIQDASTFTCLVFQLGWLQQLWTGTICICIYLSTGPL